MKDKEVARGRLIVPSQPRAGNKTTTIWILMVFLGVGILAAAGSASAANCVLDYNRLKDALRASVKPSGGPSNGGFDNNEWAVVVARDGSVCAIAYSGPSLDAQWPASRAVAAAKASTANGLSTSKYALSTAELFAAVQPGGYLYGVAAANPPNADALAAGDAATWGTAADPIVGKRAGGSIAFGGGLALFDASGIVGALGVSGDTPCADHNVAWRVRKALHLDKVPSGPTSKNNDAIIYDIGPNGKSASGFGHPTCGGREEGIATEIGAGIDPSRRP